VADFAGPASGQPLEADHIGHNLRQVRERGIDKGVIDGQDWGGLAGSSTADA
jgi:hypothetical protein